MMNTIKDQIKGVDLIKFLFDVSISVLEEYTIGSKIGSELVLMI
jgi:hypothetical protein